MYNVRVPYPFLWSTPLYGPFDRRRWPRIQTAMAVEDDSSPFESNLPEDRRPVLKMHWVIVIDENGGFSLRAGWTCLRQGEFDSSN